MQAGIAEKKISILERALEFHPGSDRLLLALLDAVSALSSSCTWTIPFCLLPSAFCLLLLAYQPWMDSDRLVGIRSFVLNMAVFAEAY